MNERIKGFALALAGAVMYGLNPLFCIPLYSAGYTPLTVVFWRYFLATVLLFVAMVIRHKNFAVSSRQICLSCVVGIFFAVSSITLFASFMMIDAGIASVILFVYPIFVALFSALLFGERISRLAGVCIIMAFAGISMLYRPENGSVAPMGFLLALLSGISYAVYLIWVNRSVLKTLPTPTITLYALLSGTVMLGLYLSLSEGVTVPESSSDWFYFAGLAIFPTVGSLLTVTKAIHLIGSTPASAMGAMEPVTALFVTVIVFGAQLTVLNVIGIVVVFASVLCIILEKR